MLKLYIGNKNYSSWSMRPWVLLTQAQIPFEEVFVRFDGFTPESDFKQKLQSITPAGKVPVLQDGELAVWDTLAIAEYVAEQFPEKKLWPQHPHQRALARSLCAEMHAGFMGLRANCPMNIEASLAQQGELIWRDKPAVRTDVARIVAMWTQLLEAHDEPMLFGAFSVIDAYYAPVCMRLKTYALPIPAAITAYIARVSALPGVKAWIDAALKENDFLDFEEPYRFKP
ncbi:MAG: glutathione S-transferase family protein [Sulfuritalea sp.]|nr:glutathione S-transferase family protein [Sulfuritalea sp.]